ncbi:MAG TPA: integration host factor [Clostridia bacterium]|jgi:hypothetical protein|nr:integration host factor [Clostridia bacterium]
MPLPYLTPEQKAEALKKAQMMRSKRTELRKALKQGEITLEEILDRKDDEIVTKMRVIYLLESLPKVGKITAQKIMDDIGISRSRRVQGLGVRQKEALLARLASREENKRRA